MESLEQSKILNQIENSKDQLVKVEEKWFDSNENAAETEFPSE
jgi:hypothetical protein